MPHRYVRKADGTWSCPPGQAYAEPLGLLYKLRSSREINWTKYGNLRYLQQYMRGPHPGVPQDIVTAICTTVAKHPGMMLLDLLRMHVGSADDIYFLIVTDQLYVDLDHELLPKPDHVHVFLDLDAASKHAAKTASPSPHPRVLSIGVGMLLWWDGKPWTIFNPGETAITLLSEDRQLKEIPRKDFDALLRDGKMSGLSSQNESEESGAARMLLDKASPKHLEVALQRYRALRSADESVPPRTMRRWRSSFREAEALHGSGYVGLLPGWSACGDRTQRLSDAQETLLTTFIADKYETLKQQPMWEVHLLLKQTAEKKEPPIPAPSYSTFIRRIKQRPRAESTRKRKGRRAAIQAEPWYWELELTTPRHGDRPEEIVHLDHTQFDIELGSSLFFRF